MVSVQRDYSVGRTSSRSIQLHSGQRVSYLPFLSGVETEHDSLCPDLAAIGAMQCGPFFNDQLPHYISWAPRQGIQGYAFPPFALIGKCLQKMNQESATVVMVALQSTQPWYPVLLESLIELPILMTMHPDMLKSPFDDRNLLMVRHKLQLAAWKPSGNDTGGRSFGRGFQAYCVRVEQMNQCGLPVSKV